jgi:hypothetical protein
MALKKTMAGPAPHTAESASPSQKVPHGHNGNAAANWTLRQLWLVQNRKYNKNNNRLAIAEHW